MSDDHEDFIIEVREQEEVIGYVHEMNDGMKTIKVEFFPSSGFGEEIRTFGYEEVANRGWSVRDEKLYGPVLKEIKLCSECEQEMFKQEKFVGEEDAKYYCPVCQ